MKLSIIVPVYNLQEGDYLIKCLESLSRIHFSDMEIWVVDDGSTDNSGIICETYARNDKRIRVIHQKHVGPSARNTGLKMATGEWILFVDGDDIVPDKFAEQLQFDKYKQYDVVFFNYYRMMPDGSIKGKEKKGNTPFVFSETDIADLPLLALSRRMSDNQKVDLKPQTVWAKLYRRSFLKDNNIIFAEKVMRAEDLIFNMNVYLNHPRCYFDPIIGYIYRKREGSLVHRYTKDLSTIKKTVLQEVEQVIKAHGRFDELKEAVDEKTVDCLFTCVFSDCCNTRNRKSYLERRQDFIALMNSEPYSTAIKKIDLSKYRLSKARGRVLAWLCKKKKFMIIELYVKCIRYICGI